MGVPGKNKLKFYADVWKKKPLNELDEVEDETYKIEVKDLFKQYFDQEKVYVTKIERNKFL